MRGIHRSPVNSLQKGQWRGDLMFSLICVWINAWVNNIEAGDLRHHCAHYDVIVMIDIVSMDVDDTLNTDHPIAIISKRNSHWSLNGNTPLFFKFDGYSIIYSPCNIIYIIVLRIVSSRCVDISQCLIWQSYNCRTCCVILNLIPHSFNVATYDHLVWLPVKYVLFFPPTHY